VRELIHLTPADVRRVPWKNGRGFTEELAFWPRESSFEAGDFDWRISKTVIDAPGPFSSFPGFDRILVVTRGEGLVLVHGDRGERVPVRRFAPQRFSGDASTKAELSAGPVSDFNVIHRSGRIAAEVRVLELGGQSVRTTLSADHAFVHALSGRVSLRIAGSAAIDCDALESLWMRELGDEVELAGSAEDTVLLLVLISSSKVAPRSRVDE
jgi:environmental stress-induced protein Ves